MFLIDCNFGPDQSVVTDLHSETRDSLPLFWLLFFTIFKSIARSLLLLALGLCFWMNFCLLGLFHLRLWALDLGFVTDYLLFVVWSFWALFAGLH